MDRIGITGTAIVELLAAMDPRVDKSLLESIRELVPSPEEAEAVLHLTGPAGGHDSADLCLRSLARVPTLELRIELFDATLSFQEAFGQPASSLAAAITAAERIQRSSCLKMALGAVLAIGNSFNGGTQLGGARGFRLESLRGVYQMRSRFRDGNLIHGVHMLLREALKRDPEMDTNPNPNPNPNPN